MYVLLFRYEYPRVARTMGSSIPHRYLQSIISCLTKSFVHYCMHTHIQTYKHLCVVYLFVNSFHRFVAFVINNSNSSYCSD